MTNCFVDIPVTLVLARRELSGALLCSSLCAVFHSNELNQTCQAVTRCSKHLLNTFSVSTATSSTKWFRPIALVLGLDCGVWASQTVELSSQIQVYPSEASRSIGWCYEVGVLGVAMPLLVGVSFVEAFLDSVSISSVT